MIDLDKIYNSIAHNFKKENEISISIGHSAQLDWLSICEHWTTEIDKRIGVLPRLKEQITPLQRQLYSLRLFKYSEYKYLFIDFDQKKRFLFEPFGFLGISSIQRQKVITHGLSYNTQDYIKLIERIIPEHLHTFFKEKSSSLSMLSINDMQQNVCLIAGSGTGKTTLMISMIEKLFHRLKQDSFVIIDPHGDLSIKLSELKLDENRIMFFTLKNFKKNNLIFSYNVFDIQEEDDLNLSKSIEQIVDAISELPVDKGHHLSANMNNLLTRCLKFIFKNIENPTLITLHELLSLHSPILEKATQLDEYFDNRFKSEEKLSRLAAKRRVENALKNDVMKSVLCTVSTFNLEQAINHNKMMIFDLSGLGNESQIAMGKFLIANIKNYVRKRDPNNLQNHTYLVIDEAQNFLGKDYEDILAQRRKFGLHVILACQYTSQLGNNAETVKYNTAVKVISGENPKDFSNLVSIPKQYLKKGYDNEAMNKIQLDSYEFLLNVRGRDMSKFKSPDYLVTNDIFKRKNSEQAKFENDQFKKYYKAYNPDVKKKYPTKKLELTSLKVEGASITLKDIPKLPFLKVKSLLLLLGQYKFLTVEQMITLKVTNHASGLPTSSLEKDKLVKSVRVQSENKPTSNKVFFLTKKGAKFLIADNGDSIRVNYPTSRISKIAQMDHKIGVINHAIELSRFDCIFLHKDIDNSGVRNTKATALEYLGKKIEPDIIFGINTEGEQKEYYTFEYERGSDSKKSLKKIIEHKLLIEAQGFQKKFNFRKVHRSLWVFEKKSNMESCMKHSKEISLPMDTFLFKLDTDNIYDGWVDFNGEEKLLFYV